MKYMKAFHALFLALAIISLSTQRLEAECTYVTDAGGYAYDECRAATNLAPAIALGTVVIVAIIAVAVQNSHGSSGHSGFSTSSGHFGSSSSSGSFSSGSFSTGSGS